ncbi:MAG: glycosyltransferase family 4 protein, partial [Desulfobacterales bacterium]|nr:glycosyltransferase family 4 protein [Desulfobacterales bacterium]
ALELPRHDAVIFQKTYSRYHRWLMAYANFLGKKTYLDLDDAPSRVNSLVTLKNVEAMMRMADGVFVGNQNLLDYAGQHQSNVHLIPSGIRLSNYQLNKKAKDPEPVCLGWVGNGAHYKKDLIDILEDPLRKLAAEKRICFKLVGACGVQDLYDTFGRIPGLKIDFVDEVEWSDPEAVSIATREFDIGLYPLLPNDFNIHKCGFKALEYMATGIPVVSSPVAVNAEIIQDGKEGLLAGSGEEWVSALTQLIESPELRQEMGRAGRYKVEKSFNTEHLAKRVKLILVGNS